MCAAASFSIARHFEVIQAFRELRVANRCMQAHRGASTQTGVSDTSCLPTAGATGGGARLASLRRMRRTITLAASLLTAVATEGLAQSSKQDPIRALQNQLEEVRSQMVILQNRIATLEAATESGEFGDP
jgi:hypothetical protein